MLTLLILLSLGAAAPGSVRRPVMEPRIVQCTAKNTADGKDRKCHVKVPRGAGIRRCDAAEKAAGHCTLDPQLVAWTAGESGARCVLSKKTDWKKRVAMKVAKGTKPGTGRCTLFVSLR